VLYANSTDGLSWNKPSLAMRDYEGNTNNNLFIPRDRPIHIMSVIHAPWEPDPDCAYQLINYVPTHHGLPGGYFAACSPDGVHLTDVASNPVVCSGQAVRPATGEPATTAATATTGRRARCCVSTEQPRAANPSSAPR